MDESFGPLLVRIRLARGWSQLRVAELLCAVSGSTTVTRHEVSRWEREERLPSGFWLRWLALVFDIAVDDLNLAAARSRRRRPGVAVAGARAAPDRPPRPAGPAADLPGGVVAGGRGG